jgi:hypothetical protein
MASQSGYEPDPIPASHLEEGTRVVAPVDHWLAIRSYISIWCRCVEASPKGVFLAPLRGFSAVMMLWCARPLGSTDKSSVLQFAF